MAAVTSLLADKPDDSKHTGLMPLSDADTETATATATAIAIATATATAAATRNAPHQAPEVDSAANELNETEAGKRRTLKYIFTGAAVVSAGAGLVWSHYQKPDAITPSRIATVAVLPFKPIVNDGRDELLEIGMADSLIARLSTLPNVIVRSVGSVRRYAGYDQDVLKAAHELDVVWMVDGSIQRR